MVSAMTAVGAREVCESVPDPELPFVTIGDLGIVREVIVDDAGHVEVVVTPTYSGCPATEIIRDDIVAALRAHGHTDVAVRTVRAPAWTTDWITPAGLEKLAANGIAPPVPGPGDRRVIDVTIGVRCPSCGSLNTKLVSRFGATPCLAMHRGADCLEPFDQVKPH
jgi:ring-1,2-phenylacetyl-CoA epoxidase subunit PaaD